MATSILALEDDPAHTEIIRRIAHDMVKADVAVVDSLEGAVRALFVETPDVILVPALLSPADEADLFSVIRQLPDAEHVEMLTTPTFGLEESQRVRNPRAWLRWGWHEPSARGIASVRGAEDERRLFAERLGWALQTARARRRAEGDRSSAPAAMTSSAQPLANQQRVVKSEASGSSTSAKVARPSHGPDGDDRRRQRRVWGPFEGQWHGAIDTPVSIRDISQGGCFVNAFCEIEVGRKLTLTVELPGGGTMEVNGLVVHAQPGLGFAVRFVDPTDRFLLSF